MRVYPIIMCGGAGTRLWPVSRPSRPKQFVAFTGEQTLFQETVSRVIGIKGFQKLLIVAGASHRSAIASQIDTDIDAVILLEPEGRDSAPAVAAATAWIADHDPDGIAVIVASDHYIPDAEKFCRAIELAAKSAQTGRIVTMGICPHMPTSAYGYIRPEGGADDHGVLAVAEFVEKPDIKTAQTYVDDGYFWNSGNFIFSVKAMSAELKRFAPDVLKYAQQGVATADRTGITWQLGEAFLNAPKISIDYAIMEKTSIASVLPISLSWSDLGAWDAVAQISVKNDQSNVEQGEVITTDTVNCYLRSSGPLIATAGISNLAVIAEDDAVLVCNLDASQDVKTLVNHMKKSKAKQVDIPTKDGFHDLTLMAQKYKQWLFASALPLWSAVGTDHDGWGFHDYLGQDGTPVKTNRRARVQARQAYVFGKAGTLGWTGNWRDGVGKAFGGLEDCYRREDGFYRALVGHDGGVIDDTPLLYDQAFMMLALSASHREVKDAEQRAILLLDLIETNKRHGAGGFVEAGNNPYASNPHMHLFETCLAWAQISDNPRWQLLAKEIADHAMLHFIDREQHFLREFFDASWQPAAGSSGQIIEPGHQFEWAWLLLKWHLIVHDDAYLKAAERLFEIGLQSLDPMRNVAVNQFQADEGVKPASQNARLWPQTERLKAALAFADYASGDKRAYYEREALSAGNSLWRYLDMDIAGLWRDTMEPDGSFVKEPVTASTLYHLVSTVEQLMTTPNG